MPQAFRDVHHTEKQTVLSFRPVGLSNERRETSKEGDVKNRAEDSLWFTVVFYLIKNTHKELALWSNCVCEHLCVCVYVRHTDKGVDG